MEVNCLSKEPKNCNMYPVVCSEGIIYNIHGLITRSDHKMKGVLKKIKNNKKVITWDPNQSATRTKYWSWKDYDFIELSTGVARATDYIGEIKTADMAQQKIWWDTIKTPNNKIQEQNLTKAYGYLNKSLKIIQGDRKWFSNKPTTWSRDIIIILGTILSALSLIIVVSYFRVTKRYLKVDKKTAQKRKLENKQDKKIEPKTEETQITPTEKTPTEITPTEITPTEINPNRDNFKKEPERSTSPKRRKIDDNVYFPALEK